MKMKRLLILMGFLTVQGAFAQEYLLMIEDGTHTVQEIVDNAEAYFVDKDKGEDSEYVKFKRWEYMAYKLMDDQGYLTPITERIAQLEAYNAYLNQTASQRQSLFDDWQELGPDYWNATTHWSPGVGRITGIAVDPSNNSHIIVGANTGGVWSTLDGGANWTPLGDYFSNLYVYSVAIDPNDADTYFFGSSSGLIYKSTDAGSTWNLLGTAGTSLVNKILLHPTDPNILYASVQNSGIFRSSDGGANWVKVVNAEVRGYDVEFKPGDPDTVYASGLGVHVSTDGGLNWTTVSGFSTGPKMMGISPDDPSVVYVVEAQSGAGGFNGFYVSTDSAGSFTMLNHTGRNYFGYDTAGFDPGGQAPRDMDITVNPNDVNEVHIAGVLTWRSTDAGVTFNCTADWVPGNAAAANIGYCHADVDILEFVGTNLFVGTDGGIYKAANTSNVNANYYEDLTTGIGIRQFYKIGITQTPQVQVTGGSQDNGSSFYNSNTGVWIDWIGADGMEGFIDKDNPLTMYGMIQFGGMYRTDNGAVSLSDIPEPNGNSGNWVTPFEQDPFITNTIYSGFDRVYVSANKGGTWSPISQAFGSNLDQLKIAPSNNQVMYTSRNAFLYRTTDGGATDWTQMTTPGGFINSIAIHPSNPDKIAVALSGSNRVKVSDDGGQTWQDYALNLPNFSALAVVWHDNGDDGLYLGMDYGVYYIDNTFSDWQPFITNLPNVIVNELEINLADSKIYAGTYGRGLWASPLYGVVQGIDDVLTPQSVVMYPNPNEGTLNIAYPGQVDVDLRVFNIAGKLVIYQPDQNLNQSLKLDLSQLQRGVYFVRVNSSKGVVTQKIVKQ